MYFLLKINVLTLMNIVILVLYNINKSHDFYMN